ncbi:hypothetical protein Leryth_013343 [Lithospermum erythrorhizon]|nr:hypothetical protein Leryth_013343 [Lithospermum erythrorhizon]
MVLGLRNKNRGSPSVQVDYLIHIQEIKPWPPSQSLRNLRAVVVQWEHGDKSSGSTIQVVPSIGTGAGVGDGRIEFNESFRLSVTLLRELSFKGRDGDSFQKNCIEFNLYEPRRDKALKGQQLGSAILDLSDHGVAAETLSISVPINCKRSYRNTVQPLLFLKIEPIQKLHARSSSKDSLARELSMENGAESVSKLMNDEYAEEAEITSFTDDDVSSHSSLAVSSGALELNGGSPCRNKQNESENIKGSIGGGKVPQASLLEEAPVNTDKEATESLRSLDASACPSSMDLSSDLAWISRRIGGSQSSDAVSKEPEREQNIESMNNLDIQEQKVKQQGIYGVDVATTLTIGKNERNVSNSSLSKDTDIDSDLQVNEKLCLPEHEATTSNVYESSSEESEKIGSNQEREQVEDISEEKSQLGDEKPMYITSLNSTINHVTSEIDEPLLNREDLVLRQDIPFIDTSKQVRSVRSAIDSSRSNGLVRNNQFVPAHMQNGLKGASSTERKDAKVYPKDTRNILTESKIMKLETRVKILEGELREAAALEVALYSIVAEHGSSINKVHAPARRLSRLYHHASKENSQLRRGSAAKSSVSGLVLVAKACGNDVPRLTFWLSNTILLRTIVIKSFEEQQLSSGTIDGGANGNNRTKNIASLKWGSLPVHKSSNSCDAAFDDWDDPRTFVVALEKVEAWIFSRIIESIWWQTLTPHMQSGAANAVRRSMPSDLNKVYSRTSTSSEQERVSFSLELWKRAFNDACERICPVRAAGHKCGCLPVLSRLIMEQCVARLDIAMFNAILRESVDEMPTDPVSDPISDTEVLPILAGSASFGAGAQLKNAIGNWSRWLTDLFDIDEDDSLVEESSSDHNNEDIKEPIGSLKSFHLLNALSDLMMLPKDMLLSKTIREEVCPLFGPQVIRRVLNAFVPDEFCPDPVPEVVLEALNSEDAFVDEQDSRINFPCMAYPISYVPPSAASISVVGDVGNNSQLRRSKSSVLKRSYTSDDELDELDSPLSSIIGNLHVSNSSSKSNSMTTSENGSPDVVRYRLLREVWTKD